MQLFTNQATDGQSEWIDVISDGLTNIYVTGNLGGGTLTLEALAPDGTTAIPITDGSFTAAGVKVIEAAPMVLRASLSGATGADVSVWADIDGIDLLGAIRGRV